MKTGFTTRTVKLENQDAGTASSSHLIVVDGATPLHGGRAEERATSEFAHTLCEFISLRNPSPKSVKGCLKDALEECATKNFPPGISAAISICTWSDSEVSLLSLGDVTCCLEANGKVEVLQNLDFTSREKELLKKVSRQLSSTHRTDDAYDAIKTDLLAEREKRNTQQGRWVADVTTDPTSIIENTWVKTLPATGVTVIALASDGAWGAVSPHGLMSEDQFLHQIAMGNADDILAKVQLAERADPKRTKAPRFSFLDDASIAWVTFGK